MGVSLYRRGRVWWARISYPHIRECRSLLTTNRKIADELRFGLERTIRIGEDLPAKAGFPIADFLEEYRAFSLSRKRPKSHRTDMARIGEFLDSLSVRTLGDVSSREVSRFLSEKTLRDSIAPATVLRYREAIHAFFEHAKRLGHIRENPVTPVPRPRLPETDPRFLTHEQIEELLRAVEGDVISPLVATLLYAGLRREEACWLTWDDLDLKSLAPVLRIRAKSVEGKSRLPKTKRSG